MAFRLWEHLVSDVGLVLAGCALADALRSGHYATGVVSVLAASALAAARTGAVGMENARVRHDQPTRRPDDEGERRFLRSLLDHSPAPLMTWSPDGRLRAINRASRRLFLTDGVVPSPPPVLSAMAHNLAAGEHRVVELVRDGRRRRFAVTVADTMLERGSLRLVALLDVEGEILAAESAAFRELVTILGHEVSNAITPVASLAETALQALRDRETGSCEQVEDALAIIARRSRSLSDFVRTYRALSRLPDPSVRPFRISELMHEVTRLFEERWRVEKVELRCSEVADEESVGDVDQLVQALTNILANAAEAAIAGPAGRAVVWISCARVGGFTRIFVTDNGAGITEENADKVLLPFFTTKVHGTGVGLALARQIAVAHSGELIVTPSGPRGGAYIEFVW